MNAGLKILFGLIVIAVGFGLFLDSPSVGMWKSVTGISWWSNFLVVLTGVIPPLLLLVGIFVVWLEADELGADKEMKAEEAEEVRASVVSDEPERKPAHHAKPRKKKR